MNVDEEQFKTRYQSLNAQLSLLSNCRLYITTHSPMRFEDKFLSLSLMFIGWQMAQKPGLLCRIAGSVSLSHSKSKLGERLAPAATSLLGIKCFLGADLEKTHGSREYAPSVPKLILQQVHFRPNAPPNAWSWVCFP